MLAGTITVVLVLLGTGTFGIFLYGYYIAEKVWMVQLAGVLAPFYGYGILGFSLLVNVMGLSRERR
jgi:hypothetical protein